MLAGHRRDGSTPDVVSLELGVVEWRPGAVLECAKRGRQLRPVNLGWIVRRPLVQLLKVYRNAWFIHRDAWFAHRDAWFAHRNAWFVNRATWFVHRYAQRG